MKTQKNLKGPRTSVMRPEWAHWWNKRVQKISWDCHLNLEVVWLKVWVPWKLFTFNTLPLQNVRTEWRILITWDLGSKSPLFFKTWDLGSKSLIFLKLEISVLNHRNFFYCQGSWLQITNIFYSLRYGSKSLIFLIAWDFSSKTPIFFWPRILVPNNQYFW